MKANLKNVIAETKELITKRLENNDPRTIDLVLAAYNRYQEDERGGVDCIFDINKKEDLLTVVNGGMTAKEIACFWREYANEHLHTPYFFFGVNHGTTYTKIINIQTLAAHLVAWLEDVTPAVFCAPWVEEYRALYEEFVSPSVKD